MYYPCSENKGADQLRGYREADLRLCFRIGKNPVFSRCGSNGHFKTVCYISIHFTLIITQIYFCGGSFCFMSWCLKNFCAVGTLCMFSYF